MSSDADERNVCTAPNWPRHRVVAWERTAVAGLVGAIILALGIVGFRFERQRRLNEALYYALWSATSARNNGDPYTAEQAEIRRLLRAGASVRERNGYGSSPLTWSVWLADDGDTSLVCEVLSHHPDVNAVDNGRTAIGEAAGAGRADIVKLLLDSGADPALPTGLTSPIMEVRKQIAGLERNIRRNPGHRVLLSKRLDGYRAVLTLLKQRAAPGD